MKKLSLIVSALLISGIGFSQNLKGLQKQVQNKVGTTPVASFSEEEAANAIKETLSKGASKASEIVAVKDGYFGDPKIKIPFPEDAKKIEDRLRSIGLNKECDEVISSLNRAAEDAGSASKEIFLQAISSMSVNDAIGIINGGENSGTNYLKSRTKNSLMERFEPIIKASLDKVGATKNWETVVTRYNRIPMVEKMNPDLVQYTTEKAIEGLFVKVAQEENNIRKNPAARTTDLLRKVYRGN